MERVLQIWTVLNKTKKESEDDTPMLVSPRRKINRSKRHSDNDTRSITSDWGEKEEEVSHSAGEEEDPVRPFRLF
tara:strand:- start:469 stop:693 length:225 start_codon:yes stop_codon:yes gene_type:complete